MKYLVIYEKSETGWGAYAPDLPGLGIAAKTLDEAKELIREAIEFHLEGLREHGDLVPVPKATTEYITV
ncbi:MAG TPA: type II toxin-antitoxin system HicB family antitoxin [Candidatus Sulfotelmatobacter sp.]